MTDLGYTWVISTDREVKKKKKKRVGVGALNLGSLISAAGFEKIIKF